MPPVASNQEELNNNEICTKNAFPFTITMVEAELNKKILRDFTGEKTGFVQVGPQKWFFPSKYLHDAENYYNFEVRPDDIWVVTFPRSGTTWTQEMVWLIANDFNYKVANAVPLIERFPFLEFSMCLHTEMKAQFLKENYFCKTRTEMVEEVAKPAWQTLKECRGPRFIKTHLPFSLLPPNLLSAGCKIIYVARNPKNVAVSFYYLNRLFRTQGYTGDFETYWDYFEKNLHHWTPYWEHVQEGWERKNEQNLLFMFYEDMNKNPRKAIEKVSKFIGKTLTKDELDKLDEHLNINNFRNNSSVNFDILKNLGILNAGEEGFIRCGTNKGWKNEYTPELEARVDKWIEENLKSTDLRFS